jgi:hypothetical protein
MGKKKTDTEEGAEGHSTSQPQIPAVPPPDDPLRRSTEFDPDREYSSREMAEKRLEAIRKTREMPTADEVSSAGGPETTAKKGKSDST